jgi:hypothetical protein
MKVATRNLLADLLVEALDDPLAATAFRLLTTYFHAARPHSPTITVEQLLESITGLCHDAALAKLQTNSLLVGDFRWGVGQVSLAAAFTAEWREIADKLARYATALQEWSPNENDTSVQHALKKGALLFNHHLFFEVHEVLEAQWMKESGKEKLFLQGLIQIAVAFAHLENQNLRGAILLLHDGLEKLTPYQPTFLGVALPAFILGIEKCRSRLQCLNLADLPQFRATMIPCLDFIV